MQSKWKGEQPIAHIEVEYKYLHFFICRSRETPFIGHVIAGMNSNDQIVWFSSILHSLYADNIFPKPEIILS